MEKIVKVAFLDGDSYMHSSIAAANLQAEVVLVRSKGEAVDKGCVTLLEYGERGLQLQLLSDNKMKPLVVDFLSNRMHYRTHSHSGKELLLKSLGEAGKGWPSILDATAGLGRDSWLLTTKASEVHACERSPVVAALLADGLKRAATNLEARDYVNKINLHHLDAISYMDTATKRLDIVYCDPMFPARTKSALVGKDMQVLQSVLGHADESESQTLWEAAMRFALRRVIVKRPRKAPLLNSVQPIYQVLGKKSRFDVYIPQT